jgi:hypothetical protein
MTGRSGAEHGLWAVVPVLRPAPVPLFVPRLVPMMRRGGGADWWEGGGYGECLKEVAATSPQVRE